MLLGQRFLSLAAQAGVMRHDINVQDYRDFAENLGKYKPAPPMFLFTEKIIA